jgi:hypothetical protein
MCSRAAFIVLLALFTHRESLNVFIIEIFRNLFHVVICSRMFSSF